MAMSQIRQKFEFGGLKRVLVRDIDLENIKIYIIAEAMIIIE